MASLRYQLRRGDKEDPAHSNLEDQTPRELTDVMSQQFHELQHPVLDPELYAVANELLFAFAPMLNRTLMSSTHGLTPKSEFIFDGIINVSFASLVGRTYPQ